MSKMLEKADLEPLLLGGCFFGSGGGGTIESARGLVKHFQKGAYYSVDQVKVVTVDEATEGDSVMVAYMGSPEAIDGAAYPLGPVLAVEQIQARLKQQGRKLAYVVPPESGALGFTVACLVAAKLGLAVVDGDGAGRAVPSLPMLTFAAQHVDPKPAVLVSQDGLTVELDVTPAKGTPGDRQHQTDVSVIVEQMMRPIVADPEFKQFGGLAMWVMTPAKLRDAVPITGTLTRALAFGQALQQGAFRTVDELLTGLHDRWGVKACALLTRGELLGAAVDTTGGFDLGTVTVKSGAQTAEVLYQNESLLAWSSHRAEPLCMAPDSICYFFEGKGDAVASNGDLVEDSGALNPAYKGRPVSVIGLTANAHLRVPGGLILDSFMQQVNQLGYRGPYVPVEKLNLARTEEVSHG